MYALLVTAAAIPGDTIPFTLWKVSKYWVFSDPYFPVFGLNTGKYGPEKNPYLDTFYVVILIGYISYPSEST